MNKIIVIKLNVNLCGQFFVNLLDFLRFFTFFGKIKTQGLLFKIALIKLPIVLKNIVQRLPYSKILINAQKRLFINFQIKVVKIDFFIFYVNLRKMIKNFVTLSK